MGSVQTQLPSDLPENEVPEYSYYDEFGEVFSELDSLKVMAKCNTYKDKKHYFVIMDGSRLVDVVNDRVKRNRHKWSLNRVNEKCFNSFILYLKNRKASSFTNASREVHNGSR